MISSSAPPSSLATARARLVAVDPEHAHQLALDHLAQGRFAVENRVFEADHAHALACYPPAGYHARIAMIANDTLLVARRDGGRYRQCFAWPGNSRGRPVACDQQFGHMLQDLALAAPCRVKS